MTKLYTLLVAITIGGTIAIPIQMLLMPGYKPSLFLTVILAYNWVMMINNNPVWAELWEKWKKKK